MLQNHSGGLHFDNQISGGQTYNYIKLIDKDDLRGKWHKIAAEVKWSKDSKIGYFNIWINGEQKVAFKGQTMQKKAKAVYFKYGIYRSYISRYKASKNVAKVPTQVVYYANVRKEFSR